MYTVVAVQWCETPAQTFQSLMRLQVLKRCTQNDRIVALMTISHCTVYSVASVHESGTVAARTAFASECALWYVVAAAATATAALSVTAHTLTTTTASAVIILLL
jgi:hypothetical protein